jgi:hypothetical protein
LQPEEVQEHQILAEAEAEVVHLPEVDQILLADSDSTAALVL